MSKFKLNASHRLEASKPDESLVLTLTGSPEALARVKAFLGMLCYNGDIGHSGIFGLGWDGDGSDKLKIPEIEQDIQKFKDGYKACCSYGGDLEMMSALGSFLCAQFSKDSDGVKSTTLVYTQKDGALI